MPKQDRPIEHQLKRVKWGIVLLAYVSTMALSIQPVHMASAQSTLPHQPAQINGISAVALQQIALLTQEKEARTPIQQKIDSHLLYAAQRKAGRLSPRLQSLDTDVKTDAKGLLEVKLTADITQQLLKRLAELGIGVSQSYPQYRALYVWARLDQLETIAAEPEVTFIAEPSQAITNQANAPIETPAIISSTPVSEAKKVKVSEQLKRFLTPEIPAAPNTPSTLQALIVSEGDVTHRANLVRSQFAVRGDGVKVGVLSDGVTSLSSRQAAGELPAVTVLPGQSGSGDEGTAMLELVHDLAPNAQLFFATGVSGIESFAQNILALRAAGCDIIIDDIGYGAESPFQKGQSGAITSTTNGGIVTEAVNAVAASGALHFSSAANSGNLTSGTSGTWEGNFASAGPAAAPLPTGGTLHDFDPSANGIQAYNVIDSNNFQFPVVIFWSDPLGASNNDYDLYTLDSSGSTIVGMSTNVQNGTQDPYEAIPVPGFGQRVVVVKNAGAADRFLHVEATKMRFSIGTTGSTRGHNAAPHSNAFGIAATPATAPGPYPGVFGPSNQIEYFSSDGPRRYFYNADGSPITPGNLLAPGGQLINKPDFTAADGTSTSTVSFSTFYGTSAAAPHAGAIAALIKSVDPSLTGAQIRNLLTSTAIDIQAAGTDHDSGAGILDAYAAAVAAGAQLRAELALGSYTSGVITGTGAVGSDGDAYLEPNEIGILSVPLTNIGTAEATAIRATLSTSATGVIILTDTVSYPSTAMTTTQTGAPFVFALTPATPCEFFINFTLTVQYSSLLKTYTQTFLIEVPTGQPTAMTLTTSYTGPVVAIPDGNNRGVDIPISVSNVAGLVDDLNFRIDGTDCVTDAGAMTVGVDHTYVGDLIFTLTSPEGQSVVLIDKIGNPRGFNDGHNFCQTTLDDLPGAPSISSAPVISAPFSGTFAPEQSLSGFIGRRAGGVWTLNVKDQFTPDSGNVRAFSLIVATFGSTCNVAPAAAQRIVSTASANQTTSVGAAFANVLQATVYNTASVPMPGVPVTFSAPSSGASVTFPSGNVTHTDALGRATVPVIANTQSGVFAVTANINPPLAAPAVFTLTNMAGAAATISVTAGSNQNSAPGALYGEPLQAKVSDGFGNPISGVVVTFSAPDSGAGVRFANGNRTINGATGNNGIASSGPLTATSEMGRFVVTANISPALSIPAQYALTNQAGVYLPLLYN